MKIAQLLSPLGQFNLGANNSADVKSISADSKRVQPGTLYVAVRGTNVDGHEFIDQAVSQGAVGLIVEDAAFVPKSFEGSFAVVTNSRKALGILASQFFGSPSKELFCVGVTGTNGKTTTTYFVEQILKNYNWSTGVIGTTGHFLGTKVWPTELTTPDPVTLQQRLREFKADGADAVAFEVSSISLHQYRVQSIDFDVMIFLNFSRDHLDYHGNMDEYFRCKTMLFTEYASQIQGKKTVAIINGDDKQTREMPLDPHLEPLYFGKNPENDFEIVIKEQSLEGSRFLLKSKLGNDEIFLPVPGEHNVFNVTAAIISCLHSGMSMASVKSAVQKISGVPGRWQRVPTLKDTNVFIDFAHTPEAMSSLLSQVQRLREPNSRIITVFGCGGGRDKGKRPMMGAVAQGKSDFVVLTSDNPRNENPGDIIEDVLSGMNKKANNIVVEPDRKEAINKALIEAKPHDIVLIVGKGHEKFQIVGDQKLDFDDFEIAKRILETT